MLSLRHVELEVPVNHVCGTIQKGVNVREYIVAPKF